MLGAHRCLDRHLSHCSRLACSALSNACLGMTWPTHERSLIPGHIPLVPGCMLIVSSNAVLLSTLATCHLAPPSCYYPVRLAWCYDAATDSVQWHTGVLRQAGHGRDIAHHVRKPCWHARRLVMSMVGYYSHSAATADRGIVHQAFADAVVQNELREFYRLMAMLGALAQRSQSATDNAYLTPRRLRVWLLDPTRRMRILGHMAQQCEGKKVRCACDAPCWQLLAVVACAGGLCHVRQCACVVFAWGAGPKERFVRLF